MGQQAYLDELATKWENAATYTLEIAQMMPDSEYMYRPTEEQRFLSRADPAYRWQYDLG